MRDRRDRGEDPSEKQLGKAAELGIHVKPGTTKFELSQLIDAAPAPTSQRELARVLGIPTNSKTTVGELMPKIRVEMIRQGLRLLDTHPALKLGNLIMHENVIYEITRVGRHSSRPSVSIRPITGGKAVSVSPFRLRNAYAVDRNGNKM